MVHQDLAMAEKLDNVQYDPVLDGHPDHISEPFNDTADSSDDLHGFASAEDLEDFLRNFSEGDAEEASCETQGNADVGGEPITTIH